MNGSGDAMGLTPPDLRDDEVMYLIRHAQRCECGHLEAFHNTEEQGEYGCGICDCWLPVFT